MVATSTARPISPATPLIPITEFNFDLRRGKSDDAVPSDDMRVSGQRVNTASGEYTVLVGGGAGKIKGGRHLKNPEETPMANLLLTILDKAGAANPGSLACRGNDVVHGQVVS